MKIRIIFLVIATVLLNSCSPRISTNLNKNYPPLDNGENVRVFGLQQSVPAGSEEIGTVKVHGVGLGAECGFDYVIEQVRMEARKAGGNAVKILKHKLPATHGNACHKIIASILKVENLNEVFKSGESQIPGNFNYAILNVYRYGGYGSLDDYNLYLGDSLLCRVENDYYERINVYTEGMNVLWAETETKFEIPVNIEFGKEYYLRCAVTPGILESRPEFELVETQNGRIEVETLKIKKKLKK
jgi:hypothetical protein